VMDSYGEILDMCDKAYNVLSQSVTGSYSLK